MTMKIFFSFFLFLLISLFECSSNQTVSIAAFNIQVFGVTKMSNQVVVQNLIKILQQYDLVAVQEIRDSSEAAFPQLVDRLNKTSGINYQYIVGPRLGRSSSKEQYGIIYNPTKFSILQSYTYDDSDDIFEREPLVVDIKIVNTENRFTLIVLHAKPGSDVTYIEIDALYDVYENSRTKFKNDNAWIVGDLNAGCSYLPRYRWSSIRLRSDSRFSWKISNETDTTSGDSGCAYDRIIGVGSQALSLYVNGSAKVYNFTKTLSLSASDSSLISDHYPVYFELISGSSGGSSGGGSGGSGDNGSGSGGNTSKPSDSKPIGAIIGGVIGGAVLIPCAVFSYFYKKKLQVFPKQQLSSVLVSK